MSELPLLHIPVRETEEVDFEPGFKDYIERVYQEDPSAYAQEIQTLNRLRQDCRGAGSDTTGRDILYRYYGQLELLDLRFPIDEDNIQIEFPWMDSFSGKKTVQYSLAFEKASIIYNTAAVLSSIASQQPRSDTIGLKTSFNYFQASAGLFLFISENFLHPPSVDLSRDSIKILVDWMLGQAQECFMEKIMLESKRGLLVSKLAMQVSQTYQNILDAIQGTVKGQFDKSWIELAKIKQKYFHALALQHKAIQLEQENKYGELVAYCTLGESVAKEASKLGSSFTSVSSLQGSQTGVQVVAEITKSLLNVMTERKTQVTKDNDMIYHESVPNVDGLPPLEKLNAVKCISFADLLPNGQADLPQIIGPDLFHRLIPIAVHQSSSLYSDEKDKLLRNNKDKIASADQEMDAILQSLNVSQHLSRLKQVMKNAQKSSEIKMPQLLVDGLERLVGERTCVSIDNYSKGVDQLKPRIQAKIQELSQTLEQEQQECERYRGLYLSEWTQEPSIKLSQFMHQDLSKMRQNLEQAEQTDNRVFTALSQHQELVSLFQMPLDQIHHAFSAQLKVKEKRPSLIDESLNKNEMGLLGEQIMVEKLDSMLQRLLNLKKERKTLLGEMKAFMEKDEITSLLLLNRGREGQVFANEIAKYNGIQGRVNDNIQLQNNLLRDLTTEFNNLKEKSQTQSELDELDAKKSVLVERWTETVDFCFQCANDLEQAHRFYNGCLEQLSKLEARISDFVGQRSGEARLLAERLEITKSHREQEQLRMQMQRMQFESQPAKVSSPQLPISSPQIQQNVPLHSLTVSAPQQMMAQPATAPSFSPTAPQTGSTVSSLPTSVPSQPIVSAQLSLPPGVQLSSLPPQPVLQPTVPQQILQQPGLRQSVPQTVQQVNTYQEPRILQQLPTSTVNQPVYPSSQPVQNQTSPTYYQPQQSQQQGYQPQQSPQQGYQQGYQNGGQISPQGYQPQQGYQNGGQSIMQQPANGQTFVYPSTQPRPGFVPQAVQQQSMQFNQQPSLQPPVQQGYSQPVSVQQHPQSVQQPVQGFNQPQTMTFQQPSYVSQHGYADPGYSDPYSPRPNVGVNPIKKSLGLDQPIGNLPPPVPVNIRPAMGAGFRPQYAQPVYPSQQPPIQHQQYPQQQIQQPPIQHQQYPQQQIQQLPIQQQQYPLQQIQQPSYQQQQISQQQQIPQQPYQQQQYPQGQYPTQQYQQPVQNMQSQYQPQMQGQYYPQTVPTGQHPPTQRQDLLQ